MAENSVQERNVFIPMDDKKRRGFIAVVLLMSASYLISAMGNSTTLPTKLNLIDGNDMYAICNALQAMGLMLSLPLAGKLSDTFGRKPIALIGMIGNMVLEFGLCFLNSQVAFVICYALVGVAGGFFLSMSYAMIADVCEPGERPKYYGLLTTLNAIGSLLGPVIAGQFVSRGMVGLGFLGFVPLRVIAIIGILLIYPNKAANLTRGKRFDFLGLVLMVASVGCIVAWLSFGGTYFQRLGLAGILLLVGGIILLALMIRRELRVDNPSVPIAIFRKKRFTVSFLCAILLGTFSFCLPAYGLIFAQYVMQQPASVASTVSMPMTVIQAVVGFVLGGWMGKNFAKRVRIIGLASAACLIIATGLMASLSAQSSIVLIYVASAVGGFTMAALPITLTPFFQSELQPTEIGAAQGMYSFAGTGGTCIFSTLAGIVTTATGSYNSVFMLECVMAIVAFVIMLIGLKMPKPAENP